MAELNDKYLKNIQDIELLKLYGEELIKLFDYLEYNLPEEQLRKQAKAVASNFVTQLIEIIEKLKNSSAEISV